jgi:butyrate kinase
LQGHVKGVVLTGGLVFSKMLVDLISNYIGFIAPVIIIPGELELEAMANGAVRALRGKEKVLVY